MNMSWLSPGDEDPRASGLLVRVLGGGVMAGGGETKRDGAAGESTASDGVAALTNPGAESAVSEWTALRGGSSDGLTLPAWNGEVTGD